MARRSLGVMFMAVVGLLVAGQGWAGPARPKSIGPQSKGRTASRHQEGAAQLNPKNLDKLKLEHSRAQDALLAAEARMGLLLKKVYDSRLVVQYEGELESPYQLARIELALDGSLAYRRKFEKAASIQALSLYDGYLLPGRHVLELRVYARGPDDPPNSLPGYFSGCGMTVHLRKRATTTALFEAEQEGNPAGRAAYRKKLPSGSWEVEITSSFETVAR